MPSLAALRLPLYIALWVDSVILLGLTAGRIGFTNKFGFYDPIIAELLVCSLFAILFAPFVLRLVHRVITHDALTYRTQTVEFIALAILWLLWLVGAADASATWPNLAWCDADQCSLIAAILAFAWMGWILITFIIILQALPYVGGSRIGGTKTEQTSVV